MIISRSHCHFFRIVHNAITSRTSIFHTVTTDDRSVDNGFGIFKILRTNFNKFRPMTSVAKNTTLLTIKKVSGIQKLVAVKTFETILVEPSAFGSDSFSFKYSAIASRTSRLVVLSICGNFLGFNWSNRFSSASSVPKFLGVATSTIYLPITGIEKR